MSDWRKTTLSKIAIFSNGKSSPSRMDDGKYPVWGSNGIIGYSNQYNSKENSVVIGRVGSYCGSVYLSNISCWITDNAIVAKHIENVSDARFLYYLLINSKLDRLRGGSGQPLINQSVLNQVEITVPSLPEQKRIADVLSCLDAKIENLRRQNETLEQIAQTLFKHWFIDFEFPFDFAQGKPNADGKPYKSSGGAMVASELGDIPKGWKVGKFEDFIEKIIDNRGKTPPIEEDGVLMMEGNQIYCEHSFPQYADKAKQKFVSEETYNNWFRAGHPQYLDILCATVGTLPKWCFMPSNQALCIAQNIIGIRADNKVCSPYWLRLFMNTRYFVKSVLGRLLTTAQPSIKVGHMTSIEVIIPNVEIISLFNMLVSSLFRKIEVNQQQIETLTKTRDSLLPKLMSGQLRVEE